MFPNSFGSVSVVATGSYEFGWEEPQINRACSGIDPRSVGLHYGQIVFEGIRGRFHEGAYQVFRADLHLERLYRSMRRLAMPVPESGVFERAMLLLLHSLPVPVPSGPGATEILYVRPLVVATDQDWSMSGSSGFELHVLAGWTRMAFDGIPKVRARLEPVERRSWPGGTGNVKVAGNYAPGFLVQRKAMAVGAHTVLWLDPATRNVEEFTSANALLVDLDDTIWAPPPSPTVLDGIVRRTVLELASDAGYLVREEPVRWPSYDSGEPRPEGGLLATGTAAGLCAIDSVKEDGPDGDILTWRSLPDVNSTVAGLNALLHTCFYGSSHPQWWASPADLRQGSVEAASVRQGQLP